MSVSIGDERLLGSYLKDRRTRLDPAALGLSGTRRRTPGLRREEVASRANISATWYTWLEQGRGGAPSADVLDRISRALMLTDVEREHLYMLGLKRPPEKQYRGADAVSPRLQRVLDMFEVSPAIVRTATWDVLAWNRAASVVLTDYATLQQHQRNILRLMFSNARIQAAQEDWKKVARYVVATFRADATRAGAASQVVELVEELREMSPEFDALWQEQDVSAAGDGVKRLHHPELGPITFEFSSFGVEGRTDLTMIVYNPVTPEDTALVRQLLES